MPDLNTVLRELGRFVLYGVAFFLLVNAGAPGASQDAAQTVAQTAGLEQLDDAVRAAADTGSSARTSLRAIAQNPEEYDGETVVVQGEASPTVYGGRFMLKQGSVQYTVRCNARVSPDKGASTTVNATFHAAEGAQDAYLACNELPS